MNSLTKELLEGLLEEDKKIVALYGGGFKPPIGGHFEVISETLNQYPEIDELIILVGSGERNGISQSEAILIWDIYKNYLPSKVKILPVKSPIGDIYRFAKENPQDIIYWIMGRREGAEDDNQDIASRSKGAKKHDNLNLKIITTQDEGMRGRNARTALKKGKPYFTPFLPDVLSKEDKSKVFDIVSPILNENASYSKDIDYKQMIQDLTDYMIEKDRNIEPLPKVEFINGDIENAKDFFGKTAHYNPDTQTITLYTEGRHPKDIVRSFAHEMVHHTQWLEDRLDDIQTTNTMEDDKLDKIEQEANLVGTMTFRNWTDTINEKKKVKDPFGLNAYALELAKGLEESLEESKMSDINLEKKRESYSEEYLEILNRFPEELQREIIDERPKGDKQDIDELKGWYLRKDKPYDISLSTLLKKEVNKGAIERTPKEVVDKINTDWDLDVKPGKVYDPNPDRYFKYAKEFSGETASPSVMVNGEVVWGMGRMIAALIRGDKTLKVWDIENKLQEELNKKEYTIYSDMDGVLVDFNNRFKRFSGGIHPADYEDKYGKEKFWDLIDNETGVRFWVGMPWMSDGKQLWNYIKNYNPTILSSPSRSNSSRMGKRIWRKRNLPSTKLVLAQAAKKQNYATPNSILIDDYESNIDQWVKAGGIGILHTDTASTINKLKELGL